MIKTESTDSEMGQKGNKLPFPLLRHGAGRPTKSHIIPALLILFIVFILYRLIDNFNSEQVSQYVSTGGADPGRQHVFPPQWNLDFDNNDKALIAQIHPGIQLLDIKIPDIYNTTEEQAEILFYKFIEKTQVSCKRMQRMGKKGDGGWDMCLNSPYLPKKPCLVYSFGISEDWSFDDDIAALLGCDVFSLDPTIDKPRFKIPDRITFQKIGLHGFNGYSHKGQMRTLGTILKDNNHAKRAIDFMKIDIEAAEWAALEVAMREGALRNVKQLAIEIHNPETYVDNVKLGSVNRDDYIRMLSILSDLERQGFRRYKYHANPVGLYTSEHTFKERSCCHELNYINMNFLQT